MWEFTSVEGLNFASNGKLTVWFYCEDISSGLVCDKFGFDVGQPLDDPPIHKLHKDIGLGKINRIYWFKNLHELCFEFSFNNNEYIVDMNGSDEKLVLKFYCKSCLNKNVNCYLVMKNSRIKLEDRNMYFTDGVRIDKTRSTSELPLPDFSLKEALRQCVYGNTVRTPDGRLYIPVNRAWTKMMGEIYGYDKKTFKGPFMFIWDSAFNSYLASFVDLNLAEENLKILMDFNLKNNGLLIQCRVGDRINNLTGLPVISYIVLKIYRRYKNFEFVRYMYPKLIKWHFWLRKNRDKNKNLLFEWGYEKKADVIIEPESSAGYESGMDNTPMYEEAKVNKKLRCIEMDCVDLSTFYALDSFSLAQLAKVLNKHKEYEFFIKEYTEVKRKINKLLWNKGLKVYINRHWDGKFASLLTPTSFYPMIAKIPSQQQAELLIKTLFDENLFWGKFVIPSIAKNSRLYNPDGDYWRGRIWPPINFFVYEGLKNYDRKSAELVAEKSLQIFLNEWKNHGHIHENYSALTGNGEPRQGVYARSCPFYTWGGLMLMQILD
ncbi:MAG: trehalase family glycosidase [Endomicrobia bacterium]|nr:trehalase family glycosidase [Endomicrobiia bacterium]